MLCLLGRYYAPDSLAVRAVCLSVGILYYGALAEIGKVPEDVLVPCRDCFCDRWQKQYCFSSVLRICVEPLGICGEGLLVVRTAEEIYSVRKSSYLCSCRHAVLTCIFFVYRCCSKGIAKYISARYNLMLCLLGRYYAPHGQTIRRISNSVIMTNYLRRDYGNLVSKYVLFYVLRYNGWWISYICIYSFSVILQRISVISSSGGHIKYTE